MAAITDALTGTINQVLENLEGMSDKYIDLEKIIPKVNDMLTDQASDLRKLNKELGTGSKTVAKFRGEIAKLSSAIGTSVRDTYELVESTSKYHQGINSASKSTLQFAKALGISASSFGDLTGKMTIMGHVSAGTFEEMYKNILQVRDAYGLTSDQVEDITAVLEKYNVIVQATDEQMIKASRVLATFESQLTSAGMEADRVANLMNSLIDPDQLMDNVVLMSKLGISVSDLVSGDPVSKLEGSVENLKALGQEIANIAKSNRLQASEMAKVYGLTLEEANQLANLDTSEHALNTQKKLEQYQNEMNTFTESITALTNRISGVLSGPLSFIGNIIQTFTNTIGMLPRGLLAVVGGVTVKKIFNKLSEWLGAAAKKFGQNMIEPMKDYLGKVGDRMSQKQSDKDSLSQNVVKNAPKIGWGYNFAARQEEIKNARERRRNIKKGALEELSAGEIIEIIQSQVSTGNQIQKTVAETKGLENVYLGKRFRNVGSVLEDASDLIEKLGLAESLGFTKNFKEQRAEFSKAKTEGEKEKAGKNLIDSILGGKMDNELLSKIKMMDKFDNQKLSTILSSENIHTDKEAIEAAIEFLSSGTWDGVTDAIKPLNEALKDMKTELEEIPPELMLETKSVVKNLTSATKGSRVFWGHFRSLMGGALKWVGNNIKKVAVGGAIGIGTTLVTGLFSTLQKSEKYQEISAKVQQQMSDLFAQIADPLEPLIESLGTLVSNFLTSPFVQWAIDRLTKLSNWLSGRLTNLVTNISDSVSTISDSYKEKDLKEMVGGVANYIGGENDKMEAILNNLYYEVIGIHKASKTANDVAIAQAVSNQ